MRIMFDVADHSVDANTLRADFAAVAEAFDMTFQLWAARAPHRTLILVSKHLHCLNDLLFRWGTGSLQIEIPAIVSNHKDAARLAASYDVPFHHVPVTPEDKPAAEAQAARAGRRAPDRPGRAGALHAGAVRPTCAGRSRGGRSTSTTRSCPASRAPGPTSRRSSTG